LLSSFSNSDVGGQIVSPIHILDSVLLFNLPLAGNNKTHTFRMMKLYVGNLSFQTSSHELEEIFAGIGSVESATVVEDRETGRSRGFGFVEMASQEDGQKAIAELDGSEQAGRNIKVNEAKPRENRSGGGGGYGGGSRW
jgi:RNA recognition motif-containing protein